MVKYTELQVKELAVLYNLGLAASQACQQVGIPSGSFTYLMRKFGHKIRPSGFQLGNFLGVRFAPKEKKMVPCPNCGKIIERCPWELKEGRKFCSCQCRSRYNATPGEKHWNWQGGHSKEIERQRKSFLYKEWRLSVYKRDNYSCQVCGLRGKELNAHHVKPVARYPESIYDVSNGQTLCIEHHKEIHRGRHH